MSLGIAVSLRFASPPTPPYLYLIFNRGNEINKHIIVAVLEFLFNLISTRSFFVLFYSDNENND